MSRQYFADTLNEPINAAFTTITAITETVLIPTLYTPIPAFEPRAGKVYELIVGGTVTTGLTGTLIIQPRLGTAIGGTSMGVSPTQTYVASVTTAPFLYRCYVIYRSIGLGATSSTVVCNGIWESGGAVATAGSSFVCAHSTTGAAVTVDTTTAQAVWIGITFSVAPSVIPNWHVWRSLN
jgi:hypothetical protein